MKQIKMPIPLIIGLVVMGVFFGIQELNQFNMKEIEVENNEDNYFIKEIEDGKISIEETDENNKIIEDNNKVIDEDDKIVEDNNEVVDDKINEEVKENTEIKKEVYTNPTANLSKNIEILDLSYNGDNVMISPTSLNISIGMLANGADGKTFVELEDFLGCDIRRYNAFARNYMEDYVNGVNIANSIWIDENYKLENVFNDTLYFDYNAEYGKLNFTSSESVDIINDWVSENTDGRIEKILDNIPVDSKTIITNVVDFDMEWNIHFTKYENGKFSNGNNVVYLMRNTDTKYYENDYATGFAINYDNNRYSFIGILPKQEGEFNVSDLDIEGLLKTGTLKKVDYKLPEFEFECDIKLKDCLESIGMENVFSSNADFSKILQEEENNNIDIVQKTKILVNRFGTKASAATTTIVFGGMFNPDEPKQVYLDRPFVFLIYDNEVDECLFIGKVVNP